MSQEKKTIKSLKSSLLSSKLQKDFYRKAREAKEEGTNPICWSFVPAGGLGELFLAMDIIPVPADNFSCACSAKQIGGELCQVAESKGWSHTLCSYFRVNMGYLEAGKEYPTPFGGLPDPDLAIGYRDSCNLYNKWTRILERHFGIPAFTVDHPYMPLRAKEKRPDNYLDYHMSQVKDCISFLEKFTGKKLDYDRLKEMLRRELKAWEYFSEVQELRRNIPCPVGGEDILGNIAILMLMPGLEEEVEFYRTLAEEVKERVKNGVGVIPQEKYRLYYAHIPPWFTLEFFTYPQNFGAVVVFEEYDSDFDPFRYLYLFDPEKPVEFLTKKLAYGNLAFLTWTERIDMMLNIVRDYKVDGAICANTLGCRNAPSAVTAFREKLEEMGIPTVTLEYDQCDPRDYTPAPIRTRIDAFMEIVQQKKGN